MLIRPDPPVHLHAHSFQSESGGVGTAANTHKNLLRADRLQLSFRGFKMHSISLKGCNLAAKIENHTLGSVSGAEHSADFVIQGTKNLREHLDDGHFGPYGIEETGKLHPNDTSADNDHILRSLLQTKGFPACDNAVPGLCQTRDWRHKSGTSGTDQNFLRAILLPLSLETEIPVRTAGNLRAGLDNFHSEIAHRHTDCSGELLCDLVLAGHHLGKIQAGALGTDSIFLAAASMIIELRAVQQGLGRNTAFVEAHASKLTFFKQESFESLRSGSLSCHISAGTGANNCDIKCHNSRSLARQLQIKLSNSFFIG